MEGLEIFIRTHCRSFHLSVLISIVSIPSKFPMYNAKVAASSSRFTLSELITLHLNFSKGLWINHCWSEDLGLGPMSIPEHSVLFGQKWVIPSPGDIPKLHGLKINDIRELRNIQEILLTDENKNFWYQKLGSSPFKAYSHIAWRSNSGLGKNTVILISFEFGRSGIHVLNCSYLIKLVRRKKSGFLLKHSMLNIFNLKEVKHKKEKLVQIHTYLLHQPNE